VQFNYDMFAYKLESACGCYLSFEGVLKISASHVHFKSGKVLIKVLDKDVETTVHKQEVMYRTAI